MPCCRHRSRQPRRQRAPMLAAGWHNHWQPMQLYIQQQQSLLQVLVARENLND